MARILIIDDNQPFREKLKIMLELEGHTVVDKHNGLFFDKILKEGHFDLLLTDIIMPGKSGFELISECKKMCPKTKIIAMSGHTNLSYSQYLEGAKRLGADNLMKKPFRIGELLSEIKSLGI